MEKERTMEGKQMKWLEYYKGKTVLVTGHTGFKGSWLCVMLEMAGAKVVGYALPPEKDAVLFDCSGAAARMVSVEGEFVIGHTCRKFFIRISRRLCFIWRHSRLCGQATSSRYIHMRPMSWVQ